MVSLGLGLMSAAIFGVAGTGIYSLGWCGRQGYTDPNPSQLRLQQRSLRAIHNRRSPREQRNSAWAWLINQPRRRLSIPSSWVDRELELPPIKPSSELVNTSKEGEAIRARMIATIPGFQELIDRLQNELLKTSRIRLCDGTPILVPSPHMVIPYLLQGDESSYHETSDDSPRQGD
jgi:hypothetical protein